ncbi:type VII secretion target [Micromonospora sp. WMMD737]|uniref:type VII secretion target n=1 Tax=Micromonospora sp. WMMD737 TaxID=3404113 RepID=UPI003B935D6F
MTSPEPLQVTPTHLHDLAARQAQAAGAVASAAESVSDLDRRILDTHGAIAASTAEALDMLQTVRRACGAAIADAGHALSVSLITSAGRYDDTDDSAGRHIDESMRQQ